MGPLWQIISHNKPYLIRFGFYTSVMRPKRRVGNIRILWLVENDVFVIASKHVWIKDAFCYYQSRFNTLIMNRFYSQAAHFTALWDFPRRYSEILNPDVNFACLLVCVQGSVLPAHRAVLVARCDVMAAMFSGKYAEARSRVVPIHGVSSDTFLSFLEYLYTDSCCPGEFTAHEPDV